MKVKKYELVRIIDKLKSVVQKNTVHPALGGVLVKEGYLIAANGEITIQVKCEDAEGESFIIPMKAFDLIKNLPEGDVELLHDDKNVVTIKMEKIKNSYQSFPAENFIYSKTDMESGEELTLPGKSFMEAISHVIYAAAEKEPSKPMLEGIYLEGCDKYINLVATDGHVLAWDRIKADGIADLKIIVPKAAAKKLLSMGMDDDVNVSYSANSAIFRTDGYVIYTRLWCNGTVSHDFPLSSMRILDYSCAVTVISRTGNSSSNNFSYCICSHLSGDSCEFYFNSEFLVF